MSGGLELTVVGVLLDRRGTPRCSIERFPALFVGKVPRNSHAGCREISLALAEVA
jgi:hypothetical protein